MEDEVPVQIVPEDEETHRQEAAFVEAVTGGPISELLTDAAAVIGFLMTSADPVEEADDGATPSGRALR